MEEVLQAVKLAQKLSSLKMQTSSLSSPPPSTSTWGFKPIEGFGSKIDALVKSLIAIKQKDPSVKSLVFSQFPEALKLVQDALTMNSVCSLVLTTGKTGENVLNQFRGTTPMKPSYSSKTKERKPKKVKSKSKLSSQNDDMISTTADVKMDDYEGAIIQVLLMPLKSTNAGLSINEATHVFLLDTGLNRGLEIQALARVRRINSTQSTYVHRLIMQDTIEAATWDLCRKALLHADHETSQNIKRSDVYSMLSNLKNLYQQCETQRDPPQGSKTPNQQLHQHIITKMRRQARDY